MDDHLLPSLDEYRSRFGITAQRAGRLAENAVILHPGPMVRGIEIDDEVASSARSRVLGQVRNGVAVRMAILYSLLGGAAPDARGVVSQDESGAVSEERTDG
jgi:aspartate carbamoyltransferase catalytic subunit